jgi:hypothetical protein
MTAALEAWQASVEKSLVGADYPGATVAPLDKKPKKKGDRKNNAR